MFVDKESLLKALSMVQAVSSYNAKLQRWVGKSLIIDEKSANIVFHFYKFI
jgi:hypothetical protein